jgi:RNA-binding protein
MSEEKAVEVVEEQAVEQPEEEGLQGVVVRCSPQLNGAQRRYLRGLGHHLEPTVLLGEKGLHDGVVTQVRRELLAHELVKVRWRGAEPEARREAALRLHQEAGAQVVQLLGMTILLYKAHPERPKIELPRKRKVSGKR